MKYLKMLGLAAVVAAALTALAAPASATILTSPVGTTYTGTFQAKSTSNITWHSAFQSVSCSASEMDGTVQSHGAAATTVIKLQSVSFTGCNFPYTVLKPGFLEIHTDTASADGNGRVTWSGMELLVHSNVGSCIFTTSGTPLGTLTGSDTGAARIDIEASIPRTGGSFFCGSSSELTGSYTITAPTPLTVD